MASEDVSHARSADRVTKLEQLPLDLAVTPSWVLLGQPNYELCQLNCNAWSANPSKGPFSSDQLSVPVKDCVGLEQQDDFIQGATRAFGVPSELGSEQRENAFLPDRDAGWPGVGESALQDTELVAKQEDLKVLVLVRQTAGGEQIQEQSEKLHQQVEMGGHAKA